MFMALLALIFGGGGGGYMANVDGQQDPPKP